jgi:hypothetical protein
MAEWQRLSNWLSSIKMDCYIPNFRDHGITKLSLLELFGDDDLYELGINAQDVPFIKQKVNEFASMIKSFTEEPVPIASNKQKHHHRSAAGHHERKSQQEPVSTNMEIHKPLGQRKKVYPPINDLEVFRKDLFHLFDESKFVEFFQLWEGFVHHYLSKEMVLLENLQSQQQQEDQQQPHKPALYYAKQAIEFHLYIYFYIASIRKNLSKEILLLTKNSLKDYLEKLTIIYENNNNLANPGELLPQNLNESLSSPVGNGQHKPLISSKEFAAFAGLVFVPNPQENPAFHLLFKEDWTNALRQRLEQFLQVVFEESKRSQPLLASQSPDLLEMADEVMNEVPVLDLEHHQHHHHNDDQERVEQQQEESELVTPTKSSTNQILDRPFRRPEEEANHHDHHGGHHQQHEGEHEGEAEEKKEESFQNLVSQTAEISPISHEKPAVQSQPKVPKLKDRLSLPLVTTNLHSGRPPAESPGSISSSISQLTDDTPLKNHDKSSPLKQAAPSLVHKKHLVQPAVPVVAVAPVVVNSQFAIHHQPPAKQIVQLSPPQQQQGFTFNKSGPLAEAANRANIRLRQLQNTTGATTTPAALPTSPPSAVGNVLPTAVQPTMKIRAMNSSSPPKSLSLQSQVDNYNKLLKQHKLPKQPAAVPSQPQTPEQDTVNNNNIPSSPQILPNPPLIRVNSATLEDVNQNLLKEMDHPNNQDLLQQIDAIIAPLTNSPPSTGPGSFNIGFNLQRGGSGQVISPLPMMASGIKGLGAFNNSVNKYKNLIKSQSASSLSLNGNDNNNKNEMSETSFLDAKLKDEQNGEEMNVGQSEEKQLEESRPDERATSKPQERETFDEEVSVAPPAPPAPPVEEEDQKSQEPHKQPKSLPVTEETIPSENNNETKAVVDEEVEEGEEGDALNESFEVQEQQPADQPKANPSSNKKKKKKKHK